MEVTSRVVELARLEGVDALTAGFVELATRLGIEEFADFESTILGIANEAVRRCLEIELQRRADDFGEAVAVDGVEHRRHQDGAVGYHSLCGLLRVRRANYRQIGVLDGPTVIPLEVAAGILANATPALAYSVTQNFAVMPLRHYEQEMKAAHRQVPSRSTLERVGKRIGDLIQATLPIIEPIVRAAEQLPAQTASISIGVDRTTVPMAERRPGAGGPRRSRTKPYARQPPDAIDVAYRMAYVATVALHDASGNELVTKRYAATPEEDPDQLIDRVFAEVAHLRAQQPSLPFTVVQDGAPEMWNLVQRGVDRHQMRPRNELIDRFHVDERLAALSIIVTDRWRCVRQGVARQGAPAAAQQRRPPRLR